MSLIAQEIHEMENETSIIMEDEVKSVRMRRKRGKKPTEQKVQMKMKTIKV